MIATLTKTEHSGKIASNRKESSFSSQLTVIDYASKPENPYMRQAIVARFYHTTSRVYCCIWINTKEIHVTGGAFAGGYGYHRASAALESACADAGVQLDKAFGGYGDQAMEEALLAIAKAIGLGDPVILDAHA